MSFDIAENPKDWTPTGELIEIANPWRHFWNLFTAQTITVPVYTKPDGEGDYLRVAFYRDDRHMIGFSLP